MAFVMATAGQRFSLEAKARAPIGRLSRSQATPPPVFAPQNIIARLGICPARSVASRNHAVNA